MRVFCVVTLFVALSSLGAARADDPALHQAFQNCGRKDDLAACDALVGRADFDTEQRTTAYAARGLVRLRMADLAGARADLVKAQAIDPHNVEVEILRDDLSDVTTDPYKKLIFHCTNTNEKDAQIRIQACTLLVNMKTPKREPLSADYEWRSAAYLDAGDFADARADLAKAEQLDPIIPAFRSDQIVATYAAGDYQAALAVAEDAVAKAPYPSGKLLLLRGQLAYLTGQDALAISDYQSSIKLNATDLEAGYWLNMLRMERHQDVTSDMQHLLGVLYPDEMGAAFVKFQLGMMTPQALMEMVDHGTFEEKPARLCRVYFNLGHKAWLSGDIPDAKQDFRDALQTKKYGLIEYQVSKVLLQKLGG